MATLASHIGSLIPEGKAKHSIRQNAFKFLFVTAGNRSVKLGTSQDKVSARIRRLLFARESLGEREIEGYLQHYQPKPGDIIINAGAYHGYFAIYLATKVGPEGKVICFEPEQNNYRLLAQNIKLNGLRNIELIKKGLWSTSGQLAITAQGSGSTLMPNTWTGQVTTTTTLDEEVRKRGLPRVDCLTMDIEGAELEAIKGCYETIRRNPGIKIAIASYHRVNGQPTCGQLEVLLQQQGLRAWTAFPRHLTTYAQHDVR